MKFDFGSLSVLTRALAIALAIVSVIAVVALLL